MLLFIDFIIQHGAGNSSAGFNIWTLINSLAGSGLGFFGAWVLFNKTQKRTRERDETLRNQGFNDKYTYFKSLLNKTPSIIKTQAKNYKDFASDIKSNLFKIHIPKSQVTTPIKRLLESKDHETFFTAFIHQLKNSNNADNIKMFENIYSKLDYYNQTIEQSLESLTILRSRVRNSMEDYKNSIKEVEYYVANLLASSTLQQNHPYYWHSINNIFQQYASQKGANSTNLQFHYARLIMPIRNISLIVSGYQIPMVHDLLILIKKASENYSAVEFHSISQAEEFEEYSKLLQQNIDEFEKAVQSI